MQLPETLTTPINALKLRYLPLLMIYFAYGATTFIGIAESVWVKEHLNISAESLMVIAVWVSLPWSGKMVFGQLVDSMPILKSVRRSYIFIAAALMAIGSLLLAGLAGQWPIVVSLGPANAIYLLASLITVIGTVVQDVVADAMSVEVVDRTETVNGEEKARPQDEVDHELAMVQLLGRLSFSLAMFLVAGLGGWLAQVLSYETMFLLTLIIPVISITGCLLVRVPKPKVPPIDKTILGGGLAYAAFAIVMGLTDVQYNQEIVFVVSLFIVLYLLFRLIKHLDKPALTAIIAAAVVIFTFRAMPSPGPGLTWWYLDELQFDKAFLGTLSQIGTGLTILGMWFGAKLITEKPVGYILAWLTIIGFVVGLPPLLMFYGLHDWTEQAFGFGARAIAMVDTAVSSPFIQLSMVPMLALIAKHAPQGNAATWFALMASLMNLALTAGALFSRYLNKVWVISREVIDPDTGIILVTANYSQLGKLLWTTSIIGLLVPLVVILVFMRKDLQSMRKKE